ncbi:MAG: ribonuclease P protein component [Methylophilaceae bacterium]|nr:ribonuclease P protein component [Methylophilaceae bacterium]
MATYGFSSRYKLLRTDEFSSVFNFQRRIQGNGLIVHYKPNGLGHPRLGIVVGKKLARRAVDRNYVKRVVREWFRTYRDQLGSIDLVVRLSKPFGRGDFYDLLRELEAIRIRLQHVMDQG